MTGVKSLECIAQSRDRNQKIRAVVSDMDGSFLDGKGMVSERNGRAVRRLLQAGIKFVVCTGRSVQEACAPLSAAGISCGMIAMNGAAILDAGGAVKREYVLAREKLGEILKAVEPWWDRLIVQMVTGEGEYIFAEEEIFRHFFRTRIFSGEERSAAQEEALFQAYRRVSREEFLERDRKCFKAVTLSEDTRLIQEIREPLAGVGGVCVAASFPTNWEITHEKASKGAGIEEYARLAGLRLDEIMAFGDGDNDRTMLSLPLGWSVAMGNGGDYLKEAAHVITGANTEDGFAQAVEVLLESRG